MGVLHRYIKKGEWNFSSSVCERGPIPFFFRDGKLGTPSNKRGFCAVQQKESRYVCKILPNKQISVKRV